MANTYELNGTSHWLTTSALFQTFIQALEAAILASGFLEVAPDTGQLTLATATKPAPNAYAGYRIYRAKDALQATKPIFLKVEYGISAGGNDPQTRFTVSTATDGAGTPTGVVSTPLAIGTSASTGTGTTASIFGGGGPAAMFVAVRPDATPSALTNVFSLGRLVDPTTGLANSLGMYHFGGGTSLAMTNIFFTDHSAAWATINWAKYFPDLNLPPNSLGTAVKTRAVKGQVIRLGEHSELPFLVGVRGEFPTAQLAANMKFDAAAWGSPHTWFPVYPSFDSGTSTITAASVPIMRWD